VGVLLSCHSVLTNGMALHIVLLVADKENVI